MKSRWFANHAEPPVLSKDDFEARLEPLRVRLLNLQYDLRQAETAVLVLLGGDDRPAGAAALRALHEWLDARYLHTHVLQGHFPEADRMRPIGWRYWTRLPPHGRIGILLGAWATEPIGARMDGEISNEAFRSTLAHARRTERDLVSDGMLLLKFWLHLPRDEHRRRLEKAKKKPDKSWQLEERDWEVLDRYDEAMELVEMTLDETHHGGVPWTIVDSRDDRHCTLALAEAIAEGLEAHLARSAGRPAAPVPSAERRSPDAPNVLDSVDLSARLDRKEYDEQKKSLQARLNGLARTARREGQASVLVLEGWDAAGKGGAIRRLTHAMPVANVRVFPVAAPDAVERAHPYLWRFWKRIPEAGRTSIFDRSWYGRVLVERVEGLASPDEWQRAYGELNDFEASLTDFGVPVIKFFLHLDAEEQMRRFEARALTDYKKYKLTDEDLRNREKWPLYRDAVHDMVERTSTPTAPWHLIAANDKRHARIEVLRVVCQGLERALDARS